MTPDLTHLDVLVVGVGPASLCAAILLAEADIEVGVLSPRPPSGAAEAALVAKAERVGVTVHTRTFVTDLLTSREGRAGGAVTVDLETGATRVVRSRAVVLEAGGYSAVFARSTAGPEGARGGAQALAYRAGAGLRDMEFVRFHPAGALWPLAERGRFVPEAALVRGDRLFNVVGERVDAPPVTEAAARVDLDRLARLVYAQVQSGHGTPNGGVWLDLSFQGGAGEGRPTLVEIAPTVTDTMGGIHIADPATFETAVPGLFAVGEGLAGIHGHDRLQPAAPPDTEVFGRAVAAHLASHLPHVVDLPDDQAPRAAARLDALATSRGAHDPTALQDRLRRVMWDHAGALRNGEGLLAGLGTLYGLRRATYDLDVGSRTDPRFEQALALQAMLTTAEAVLHGAEARTESRGVHVRSDFPDALEWCRTSFLLHRGLSGGMTVNALVAADPVLAGDPGEHLRDSRCAS